MKKFVYPIAVILSLFIIDTCASKPDEAVIKALNDSKAKVEDSRKLAMDFECSNYASDEWNSAEALYNAAQALTPVSMEDYQAAVLQYNGVAAGYDSVISKSMPMYRDSRTAAVQSARDKAVAAGADAAFADEIKAVDDKIAEDDVLFEEMEYYGFRTASMDTESRYAVLETRAAGLSLKNEIDANRLARFSPETYDGANASADKSKVSYDENNVSAAKTEAEDALAKYQQTLSDGWKAYAEEQAPLAQTARSNAVNAKADVAFEKDFADADAVYSQGTSDYESQNYKSAADSFVKTQPLFAALAKSAADKQKAASAAVAAAQKKYTDSQNKARAVPETANNQYLTKSAQALAEAQKNLDGGGFDAATAAAAESQKNASLSDDYVAQQKKADEAVAALARAKNRLDWAVSIGAEQQYTDQYEKANSAYNDALEAQKSRDWDKTTDRANSIVAIVDAIETLKMGEAYDAMSTAKERLDWAVGVRAADNYPDAFTSAGASYALGEKALTAKDWNGAIVAADATLNALAAISDRAALPAQYTVRTWQGVRDCLWNIAGYPWVYNDPFQWRTLYNANRDKLPNINDVSSLEPDTVLDIPSIRGEIRSGIWEEGKTYPDMPL
jgi:hypothetical protein